MMPMFANAGIAGGGIGGIGRLCPEPNVAELLAAGIEVGSWLLAVSQAFPERSAHHLSCRIRSAHTWGVLQDVQALLQGRGCT